MSELEGTLLRDSDPFSYFMILAFESSGLLRFALLLLLWPIISLLGPLGLEDIKIKVMTFVAVAGVSESEIAAVARAVLPKFMMEDLDMEAWKVFSRGERRVVVTKMPRVMVERFAKEHLRADEVVGCELWVSRIGLATGMVRGGSFEASSCERVAKVFQSDAPALGLGRPGPSGSFLRLCKVIDSHRKLFSKTVLIIN